MQFPFKMAGNSGFVQANHGAGEFLLRPPAYKGEKVPRKRGVWTNILWICFYMRILENGVGSPTWNCFMIINISMPPQSL